MWFSLSFSSYQWNWDFCEAHQCHHYTWRGQVVGLWNFWNKWPKIIAKNWFFSTLVKYFACGGEEQWRLDPSQFMWSFSPDCFTYIEYRSKTYSARAKDLGMKTHVLSMTTYVLYFFDLYLSKLSTFAFEKDVLYPGPKGSKPFDAFAPW